MLFHLPQASLHILRQLLSVPGVAKTAGDLYADGQLLYETLPEVDLAWVLPPDEQAALPPDQKKLYEQFDRTWSETQLDIELTDKQLARIKAVLLLVPTLGTVPVPQSKFIFLLYQKFGVTSPP